MDFASDGDLY